ncbi:cytochrome P450 736A117-like [Malania oleifera]|uniref:cytochrome P450 736A117-like n=1 Tax=Malania oleifera TaxID=397392 RepID=UPI0025AECCF6|nr:cytochrome P450 736A117-like [Malania oleifera]
MFYLFFNPSLLIFLPLLFFVFKWFSRANPIPSKKCFPPSPPKLPIIGNLHQLGLHPHRTLRSLAQHHGPIMLLQLGTVPTLVVSSATLAREIMKTHDTIFSNRPHTSTGRRLVYDCKDVVLGRYDRYWRQMRSICVTHLFSTKRVQSFRAVREEETALVLNEVEKSYYSSSWINLSEVLASLTSAVMCRVAFGRKYGEGEDGRRFKGLLEELGELLGCFNVEDFFPWLAWVNYITGFNARVERVFHEFDNFFDLIVDDHMAHRSGVADGNCGGRREDYQMDLVDVLLDIQDNSTDGDSLARDNIKAIILDMFAAGTATTYTVLEWAMTELLRSKEVMEEVQKEVRGIAGSKPSINEDDLEGMHYLKAVIKEALRLHPPAPLLIPRESTEDVRIEGYDIMAKTQVLVNA